jgi:hypothetical protein
MRKEMLLDRQVNIQLQNDNGGKGRVFVARFIESALVGYGEDGVLNVTNEALSRFYQTMIGCPVIIKHQDVTDDNAQDIRVGVVSNVEYTNDGWYSCSGVIWDKEALDLIGKGWSVSCTYEVLETTGVSGERNNVPFDDELVNGRFLHLAIVPNPRYEKATITLMNSKGKGMWKNIFNSKKLKNSEEKEKDMAKQNEADTDKNALKNKIMEHINGAIKGDKKVDGEGEDSWYKELREMLDKLAYTKSEDEKSNSDDSEKEEEEKKDNSEEDKEDKENKCNSDDSEKDKEEKDNSEDDSDEDADKKDNSEDEDKEKEEKSNEDDSEKEEDKKDNSEEEDKKDVKDNSKDLNRLHNSGLEIKKSGYESEKSRLALGNKLF